MPPTSHRWPLTTYSSCTVAAAPPVTVSEASWLTSSAVASRAALVRIATALTMPNAAIAPAASVLTLRKRR